MLYVQEVVTQGEKIVFGAQYHWMFLVRGFISLAFYWLAAFLVLWVGVAAYYYPETQLVYLHKAITAVNMDIFVANVWHLKMLWRMVAFSLILLGLFHLGMVFLVRATTEIAVTSKRLIFKRGWVARNVQEMAINNIESVAVNQSLFGRLLGYGSVDCFGTGDGDIDLPSMVDNPITLRRMIQMVQSEALDRRSI